jgi:uncharacterized protein YndB with AHSA1/START domain
MPAEKSPANAPSENEHVITRVFEAPREKVWKARTEPEMAKNRRGPQA